MEFSLNFGTGLQYPRFFDLKLMYSYVIEIAESEYNLGLHGKALLSKILLFLQIKMTKTI